MCCISANRIKIPHERMKVAYLLGSGLSIPFGLPSVGDLTDKIMQEGQNYTLRSDQTYGNGGQGICSPDGDITPIVIEFLRLVQGIIGSRAAINYIKEPNYEDMADFIKQYHHSLGNQYENPALSKQYLERISCFALKHGVDVTRLLEYSLKFIDLMLQQFLNRGKIKASSLLWIINNIIPDFLARDQLDIFSLNHDMLMEHYLDTNKISFDDGYYNNDDGLSCYNFKRLWISTKRVRLVKLHGSIDRYIHNKSMIRTNDPRYISDPSSYGFSDTFVPSIIVGKIVKLFDYSKPIYADLHSYFRIKLATEISTLIVVGYGFADKGINDAIFSWFGLNKKNRLIVITFDEASLISNSRPALRSILEAPNCRQVRRVIILDGGVQKIASDKIINALQ